MCRKVSLNFSLPAKVIAHPHVVTVCIPFGCSQQQGAEALILNMKQEEETWDDDFPQVPYHTLRLPQDSIFVVDKEESFKQFLDYIKVSAVINLILHCVSINSTECLLQGGCLFTEISQQI